MIINGEDNVRVEAMPLEIVWRNPLALVTRSTRTHAITLNCSKIEGC